jgi:hypothetical protein
MSLSCLLLHGSMQSRPCPQTPAKRTPQPRAVMQYCHHPGHTLPVVTPGTRMLNLIQGAARCCACCWPVVPSRHHFMGGSSKLEGHWSGDTPAQHVGCLPSQMHLPSSNRLLHTGVPCCMGAAQQAAWLSNTHRQTEQAKMVGGCSAAHKQSPA